MSASRDRDLECLFPGDSELALRMRALDWSRTELGLPERWPQNLRVAVSLCLTSRFPIVLLWGPKLTLLYNDAYVPLLAETKHPRCLGRPGHECWYEIWETIGPMLAGVLATGKATWSEDVGLCFTRKLPREEVYIRFTYGPLLAADGRTVEGIFAPCTETTEQVVGARRLETLRKLGVKTAHARSVQAACAEAARALSENPHDIPFAAIYVADEAGCKATLAASARLSVRHLLPWSVSVEQEDAAPWPLASVLCTRQAEDVFDLDRLAMPLSGGPWPEPAAHAVVLPIPAPTHDSLAGLLVVGVSPRRVWDAAYRTFFDLVAGHIGTTLVDAKAYETERQRAEALAEIDRVKTAFFSNVSHEFRTPLTLMIGPTESALASADCALRGADLEMVYRNQLRLLRLVNALLDFSRIEAGRIQASYLPTDLSVLTADVASAFRSAVEKAGLRLVVDCQPLSQSIYVDRDMWEKIVLNLLSNAFKFTFEGEIVVSLREMDEYAEISIRDTGIGIAAATFRISSSASIESKAPALAPTRGQE